MKRFRAPFGASILVLTLAVAPLHAANKELKTVLSAAEVLQDLSAIPLKCIPPAMLHDAKGVAIFPHMVKVGLLVDRRFGHGVMLVRQPDGSWSDPVFITLEGGGVGLEAGIEATDLVLVFKTDKSVERILRGNGRLTLGTDAVVAAGPLGRDTEMATEGRLRPEIYSYSKSHGLFAGVSLTGARLKVDPQANETFYGLRGGLPQDVVIRHGVAIPAAETLKAELSTLSGAPSGPPVYFTPVPVSGPGPMPTQPPSYPVPVPVPFQPPMYRQP
jgi:lipid-binding SYLF domain-containing protein